MTPVLIGVDWGTTSFRAHLLTAAGEAVDRFADGGGILSVKGGDFEQYLLERIEGWNRAHGRLPIMASGMITSRNGWVETPYLEAPIGPADLAKALHELVLGNGQSIHFVTGLAIEDEDGVPDVMRGEETELMGQLASSGRQSGIFVTPGTHSKWAEVDGGKLTGFQTYMTGEVFSAVRQHTILGHLIPGEVEDEAGFVAGVRARLDATGSLLHQLFSARSMPLFERMPLEWIAPYLSGLLIGEEIMTALAHYQCKSVCVIGRGDLVRLYEIALGEASCAVCVAEAGQAMRGQLELARLAGVIR